MKAHPILFNGDMVRAILAGTKTQTRRLFKLPAGTAWYCSGAMRGEETGDVHDLNGPGWCSIDELSCPYGAPGDRLWVRETHAPQPDCLLAWANWQRGMDGPKPIIHYAADRSRHAWVDRWLPSIHMPRWASRITLEITSVRVERLTNISEKDARAEGIQRGQDGMWNGATHKVKGTPRAFHTAVGAFDDLWTSINGAESWAANPWVWAVEFKRVEACNG